MYKILTFVFILCVQFVSYAQNDIEMVEPDYIKSVILHAKKANAYAPIIRLGERFVFSFDDLEGDEKDYNYTLTHCSSDWSVTNITSSEFLNGFNGDTIRNYENSFNTYQDYTHYELQIPNKTVQIKISGNYIISVLDDDDNLIFTRRFIVYQNKVDVGVSTHKARQIDAINTKQNIEISINYPKLTINNPSEEIKIAIYKNNDWNSVVTNIKPQYYRGTQLLYKYDEETSFFGENEFLYFDTKDYRSATNNIRQVRLNDVYETRLYVDYSRQWKSYTYYPDINGNFLIRTLNADHKTTEADYTKVHFTYKSLELSDDTNLYVYGAFNNWQFTETNKLKPTDHGFYETDILLKQGFYNYTYVTLDQDNYLNTLVEGTHYQTENDYTVLVYYSKFGSKYDEVIGYGVGNSTNLKN